MSRWSRDVPVADFAFYVEEDEGEEEVKPYVQRRCVCLAMVVSCAVIPRLADLSLGRVQ